MNQNNISLETVLHALYGCANVQSEFTGAVYVCPTCAYGKDDGRPCESLHPLLNDAYALLKAQEPHLITKADFADNPMIDDGGYLPAWVEFNREKYGEFFEEDADGWGCVNINKVGNDMARYWTAKPSLKQMEETPWN